MDLMKKMGFRSRKMLTDWNSGRRDVFRTDRIRHNQNSLLDGLWLAGKHAARTAYP
jgi:hypothetical protein